MQESIQKICKTSLGYDVDISTVENQIKKLSCDNKNHIIAVYEDENTKKGYRICSCTGV